jgi:allene oxide cyclase
MRATHVLLPLTAMLVGAGLIGGCGSSTDDTTLSLIEHAETDTVRHIGPAKEEDSSGDILAFANPVFNASNARKVGSDNGNCVRTAAGEAWECIWTVSLSGGQITVEGPFYDGKDSTLAITGGTGEYGGAGGQMQLHARDPEETEYDFTYEIEG